MYQIHQQLRPVPAYFQWLQRERLDAFGILVVLWVLA